MVGAEKAGRLTGSAPVVVATEVPLMLRTPLTPA